MEGGDFIVAALNDSISAAGSLARRPTEWNEMRRERTDYLSDRIPAHFVVGLGHLLLGWDANRSLDHHGGLSPAAGHKRSGKESYSSTF